MSEKHKTRKAVAGFLILLFILILIQSAYSENQTAPATEYKYIGNVKTKKYHKLDCRSAKKIKTKNCIYFKSKEEAEKQGYVPCKICKP
ncbi:MAG TPA: Ada metal-binding domain-containing protein [candidate division Zixibacteria bacterium]